MATYISEVSTLESQISDLSLEMKTLRLPVSNIYSHCAEANEFCECPSGNQITLKWYKVDRDYYTETVIKSNSSGVICED
jgi:hypothetical protein